MDYKLLLYPSDSDMFEGDYHSLEVPERSPSIISNIQPSQLPHLCSVIHIPRHSRHSSSNISDIVGPSPFSSLRGRSRLWCLRDVGRSTPPSTTLTKPRCSSNRRSNSGPNSPRALSDSGSAANISDWTVAHLRHTLSQRSTLFHRSDKKAKLFQLLTDWKGVEQYSTLPCRASRALPGLQQCNNYNNLGWPLGAKAAQKYSTLFLKHSAGSRQTTTNSLMSSTSVMTSSPPSYGLNTLTSTFHEQVPLAPRWNSWASPSTPFHSKHPCLLRQSTGLPYSFQTSFWFTHVPNGNYSRCRATSTTPSVSSPKVVPSCHTSSL